MEFEYRERETKRTQSEAHNFTANAGRSKTLDAAELQSIADLFEVNGIDEVWEIGVINSIHSPNHFDAYTGHQSPPVVTTDISMVTVHITNEVVPMAFKLACT